MRGSGRFIKVWGLHFWAYLMLQSNFLFMNNSSWSLEVRLGALISPDKYSQDLKSSSILLASSLSKMIASVITYPHEVVRTRMQTQIGNSRNAVYKTLIQSFSLIYKREGISSFYKGLGINLLRTVPTTSISLLAYEIIAFKLEKYI